jgi:hypothetical protein
MAADDLGFVVSAWSSSFRTSPYAGLLSMVRYADIMHREIGEILARPSTAAIVRYDAIQRDDRGRQLLYGFLVHRTDLGRPYVYYVYVRAAWADRPPIRRQGHAAALFAAAGIDPARAFSYACRTAASDALTQPQWIGGIPQPAKLPHAKWDQLPARYEEPHEQAEHRQSRNRR